MTEKGTRVYSISEIKAMLSEKKEIPEELELLYTNKQKHLKKWFERYVVLEIKDPNLQEEKDDIGELLNIDLSVEVDEEDDAKEDVEVDKVEIEVWVDEE